MPREKIRVRRVRSWDGNEYDLGFELKIARSSSGGVLSAPSAPQVQKHWTICVKTSPRSYGHFNIHETDQITGEHRDLIDIDMLAAIDRLSQRDIVSELRDRLISASYSVSDPSEFWMVGITSLMPVPTERGTFTMSQGSDIVY